jgi:AspT/YidE/YbjL antiporter-like protein
LLVAVLISQVGVEIDDGVKAILFALFIYAVGFESGPQFFRSLGRQSIREIAMAAVLAISGLATVVIMARIFGLDKGIAAGIAAGGLTQSAIIGTASAAISKLGVAAEEAQRLQANVAVGYAVTYIFGSFGAIIICVNLLPRIMGGSRTPFRSQGFGAGGKRCRTRSGRPYLPRKRGRWEDSCPKRGTCRT